MPGGGRWIDLDPYQLELITQYYDGTTHQELVRWLNDTHNIKVSLRTIKSRFKEWQVSRRVTAEEEAQLKPLIQALYFQVGLDDSDILIDLKRQGYQISAYTLVRLRFELGLRRRIRDPEQQREAEQVVRALVEEGIQSGAIEGYGKQFLYLHFKQMGMNVTRDRMFQAYRTLNPTGIERRNEDRQRRKGEYLVRGPNFIWSVDGHEKLKPYGFEIYACIDAYSRYIIWIFVGISAGTAVSVGQQYLNAVRETGVIPHYIRSDCGKETGQLAYAHFRLSDSNEPGCPFEKCYMYGTSTANQRIESWWQQLSRSLLFRWRVYFKNLEQENLFSAARTADQITLFAVYFPVLREEIYSYVNIWNAHKIRPQRNRPNAVVGRPYMLYYNPPTGTENFGTPYDHEMHENLVSHLPPWDVTAFLPVETYEWCENQLKLIGFNPYEARLQTLNERESPFRDIYTQLRVQVVRHIHSGEQPILSLLPHPVGSWEWNVQAWTDGLDGLDGLVQEVDLETDYRE